MLEISKAVVDALASDVYQRLPRQFTKTLLQDHPDLFRPDNAEHLHAFVVRTLEPARTIGLKSAAALFTFVKLAVFVHPMFYRHPVVHNALHDAYATPDERLRNLGTTVPDPVWTEIRKQPGRIIA